MPKRIQRKRTKGWRMPQNAVYVGRPTKWGNPYRWSDYPSVECVEGEYEGIPASVRREYAVVDFKAAVKYRIGLSNYPSAEEIRRELAGKNLVCWCSEDGPCHADVLLEIANAPEASGANPT